MRRRTRQLSSRRPIEPDSDETFEVLRTKTVLQKSVGYLGRARQPVAKAGGLLARLEIRMTPSRRPPWATWGW